MEAEVRDILAQASLEPRERPDAKELQAWVDSLYKDRTPDFELSRLWDTWLTLRHWSANWARPLYDDVEKRKLLKPEVLFEVEGSLGLTAERVYAAGTARTEWFRALAKLFEKYDFLALPTAQVFPFSKDVHWPDRINEREMDTYHRWMEVVIGGCSNSRSLTSRSRAFSTGAPPCNPVGL